MNKIDLSLGVDISDGKGYLFFNDDLSLKTYNKLAEKKRTNAFIDSRYIVYPHIFEAKNLKGLKPETFRISREKYNNIYFEFYYLLAQFLDACLKELFGVYFGDFIQKHTLTVRIFPFKEKNEYVQKAFVDMFKCEFPKLIFEFCNVDLWNDLSSIYSDYMPGSNEEFHPYIDKAGGVRFVSFQTVNGFEINGYADDEYVIFEPIKDYEDYKVFDDFKQLIRKRHER